MKNPLDQDAFYANLKVKLEETTTWPSSYLYKFIIKTDASKVKTLEAIFDNTGAVIKTTPSKKGNYISISIHVEMLSPDAVIDKYLEVSRTVEGVISL
jgi:putative lipoic acid-binding regulatory protein